MKKKVNKPTDRRSDLNEDEQFPGYPAYPPGEDITNRGDKEPIDIENVTRSSRINNELARGAGNFPEKDESEEGLDIPGAELDDEDESIGGEDEENNYYSLGGDRHDNLEEDDEDLDGDNEDR